MPYSVILTSKLCWCRAALEKLRQAIANGRGNETTKRNKILSQAEKELKKFTYELSSATAEVFCALTLFFNLQFLSPVSTLMHGIDIAILSVCPFVHPSIYLSIAFRYYMETAEHSFAE